MNGPMMAWFSGLNRKADEAGFIAVYPNGTGHFSSFTWNGGNCCGSAMRNNVDDVAFINTLLDDLIGSYHVDTQTNLCHGHIERGGHGLPACLGTFRSHRRHRSGIRLDGNGNRPTKTSGVGHALSRHVG